MPIFKDYAHYYKLIYSNKPYQQEAEFVYKWANYPKTILELGIGTGGHAQYWCKKSKIRGIDSSLEMIKRAYRHPNIKYLCSPIEILEKIRFPLVDCVYAMFNVMGYCLLEQTLPHLPLKPKGYFIFDIWDASKFKQYPPVPKVNYFPFGYRLAVPNQLTKRVLRIDFVIVEQKEIKAFENHYVQGYFKKDIERLCKLHHYKIVGFKPTKTWTCWYKLQKQ